jgi:transcriptional regulator with XRE-family HTH domain
MTGMSMTTDTGTVPRWGLDDRLRKSLSHAQVSIDEMAAEIGVSRQSVSGWLNGHREPRIGFLKLWALRTGVPLSWLLEGVEPAKSGLGSGNLRFPTSSGRAA